MVGHGDGHTHHEIRTDIMHYMWLQCAFALAVFIATVLYFPSTPPSSPSRSAETLRVDFTTGLKEVCDGLFLL